MDIDVELSSRLKQKYNHTLTKCYENVAELLRKSEVDRIVYGYTRTDGSIVLIRHCWGIKDSKIIDSTYEEDTLLKTEYFPMFKFNGLNEYVKAIPKTLGPAMIDFDIETEWSFQADLTKKLGAVVFIGNHSEDGE